MVNRLYSQGCFKTGHLSTDWIVEKVETNLRSDARKEFKYLLKEKIIVPYKESLGKKHFHLNVKKLGMVNAYNDYYPFINKLYKYLSKK